MFGVKETYIAGHRRESGSGNSLMNLGKCLGLYVVNTQ